MHRPNSEWSVANFLSKEWLLFHLGRLKQDETKREREREISAAILFS
jgi:hypothetical protein